MKRDCPYGQGEKGESKDPFEEGVLVEGEDSAAKSPSVVEGEEGGLLRAGLRR
jgi:hypothetical protein